jgi:SAM-dependent methyltransferase
MDDPSLAEAEHLHALSALARINAVSRTAATLAKAIGLLLPAKGDREPVVIVDVACGGGDVTIDVARRLTGSAGEDVGVRIIGVDVSPRGVERSRQAAAARGITAAFECRDVLADGVPPCDVAISSLFLHHLDDATACHLLGRMAEAARWGIVISDLLRSRLGLGLAILGTRFLSSSRVARVDGPLSVRAARTLAEYRRLVDAAGLGTATIRRIWPERAILTWHRSPESA